MSQDNDYGVYRLNYGNPDFGELHKDEKRISPFAVNIMSAMYTGMFKGKFIKKIKLVCKDECYCSFQNTLKSFYIVPGIEYDVSSAAEEWIGNTFTNGKPPSYDGCQFTIIFTEKKLHEFSFIIN